MIVVPRWEYAHVGYNYGTGAHRSVAFTNGAVWDKIPDNYIGLLARLGDEGWELVTSTPSPDNKGIASVFKRPKQAEQPAPDE